MEALHQSVEALGTSSTLTGTRTLNSRGGWWLATTTRCPTRIRSGRRSTRRRRTSRPSWTTRRLLLAGRTTVRPSTQRSRRTEMRSLPELRQGPSGHRVALAAIHDSDACLRTRPRASERRSSLGIRNRARHVTTHLSLTLSSVESLLDAAAGKRCLTTLDQNRSSRCPVSRQVGPAGRAGPSATATWRPGLWWRPALRSSASASLRKPTSTARSIPLSKELKARVREGFTVVVK